jgi:hypothetical protein
MSVGWGSLQKKIAKNGVSDFVFCTRQKRERAKSSATQKE